jgi:hypothetical protein
MIENQTIELRDVRRDEPKGADGSPSSHPALFPQSESEGFRSRWHDIQSRFVDEPRHAVEEADQLVAAVISRLAEVFAGERDVLEREWKGQDVSTEDLRQALRRYRSFFDRLFSM